MKVFSVAGYTKSGKTTTIEEVIQVLKSRNYSVGSVKDIHFEAFKMDQEGTNTDRHRKAGSQLVTARGLHETDILFQRQLDLYEIAKFYEVDYLVVEGIRDANVPMILTADCQKDLNERWNDHVFAVSGKIADQIEDYRGLPAISAMDQAEKLVDLIERKVFDLLPDFPYDCCHACGGTCRELGVSILKGEKDRADCVLDQSAVRLTINGNPIPMVPFVQNILKNAVMGVVQELEGFQEEPSIKVELGPAWKK